MIWSIKVTNFVKAWPLNSCMFLILHEEMLANHKSLILYTEVWLLSSGEVLEWLVELKEVGVSDFKFPQPYYWRCWSGLWHYVTGCFPTLWRHYISFRTLGNTYPATQCHIPDLNPQEVGKTVQDFWFSTWSTLWRDDNFLFFHLSGILIISAD